MSKSFGIIYLAVALGALAGLWWFSDELAAERASHAAVRAAIGTTQEKLAAALAERDELQRLLDSGQAGGAVAPNAAQPQTAPPPREEQAAESTPAAQQDSFPEGRALMAEARIRAISKVVPLTEDQRAKLTELFQTQGRQFDNTALDGIIGKENADFYRDQRRRSFETAAGEAQEKEVLFMSRRLQLSQQQEEQIRSIYADVQRQVRAQMEEAFKDRQRGRMVMLGRMMAENQARDTLLEAKMKEVLDSQQYQNFLALQASSASRELEMWHGP